MSADIQCPDEREILRQMDQANKYQAGFAPRDKEPLTIMLINHRRSCPYCQGKPEIVYNAFFEKALQKFAKEKVTVTA